MVAPQPIAWSPAVLWTLLYVAAGPSIIAFRCWGSGVAEAGPSAAAYFGNLTPRFAALLSVAVLSELPPPCHGLAFALVVAGIIVFSRR